MNKNITKHLIAQFQNREDFHTIVLFINNNIEILLKEEHYFTNKEKCQFYAYYFHYCENLQENKQKELFFHILFENFCIKGFYLNIVIRVNYFLNNQQIFFYPEKTFYKGVLIKNNKIRNYKFNYIEQEGKIQIERSKVTEQIILIKEINRINKEQTKKFLNWINSEYNIKKYKKAQNIQLIKSLSQLLILNILFFIFFKYIEFF